MSFPPNFRANRAAGSATAECSRGPIMTLGLLGRLCRLNARLFASVAPDVKTVCKSSEKYELML